MKLKVADSVTGLKLLSDGRLVVMTSLHIFTYSLRQVKYALVYLHRLVKYA